MTKDGIKQAIKVAVPVVILLVMAFGIRSCVLENYQNNLQTKADRQKEQQIRRAKLEPKEMTFTLPADDTTMWYETNRQKVLVQYNPGPVKIEYGKTRTDGTIGFIASRGVAESGTHYRGSDIPDHREYDWVRVTAIGVTSDITLNLNLGR